MEENSIAINTSEGKVFFIDFSDKKKALIKDGQNHDVGEVTMVGQKYSVEEVMKQRGTIDEHRFKHALGEQIFYNARAGWSSSNERIMTTGTGKIARVYKRVA